MQAKYQIDSVDRDILGHLLHDARMPYLEIARKLIVSGGTIHQRIEKMKEAGIIEGSQVKLNLKKLGYDITVFLGVHLKSTKDINQVIEKLRSFPEVTEAYFTTGNYALLVKVNTKNIGDFHQFLVNKLQKIESVHATESFISLDQPIAKDVHIN
jgi:Lrp/AsnC family transcriptional regulator for asnA, asnC and gidA